jgi:lysophospholipase L1-like esterase
VNVVLLQRLLKHLGICVVSICVTLLLLEAGIRIASPQDLGFWDSHSFRRLQSTAPHFVENIPRGRALFIGVPVAINSLGLRGEEIAVPKPPNTIRIVAVGDSITFGYGIPVDDTYAKALERRLNERVPDGMRYEVLNGGTLGGSLSDYLHFLNQKAEVIQPDVVLISLCLNDILLYSESGSVSEAGAQWHAWRMPWIRRFSHFLLRHSQLYMFGYAHLKSFLCGSGALDINKVRGLNFVALAPPSEYQKQAWASSLGMLSRIAAFCREHGYRLVVVAFPMQMQLSAAELHFYRDKYHLRLGDDTLSGDPQRRLQEFAFATGVTLVDLLPIYRGYNPEDLYLHTSMIPADPTHPSIKGNQIAADEIFGALQRTGALAR